jgi:hypothetical protein
MLPKWVRKLTKHTNQTKLQVIILDESNFEFGS